MEKPAPAFDRYLKYRNNEVRDADYQTRYTERMIARGIPVVTDASGESDKPVWRGDHAFNSAAASYSLMHFIEPEVAVEHPDWGTHKVKEEARGRFAKRLAQDLTYEKRESNHEETAVRWQPIKTQGGGMELATEYGGGMITLRELWEHTKEYAAFVGNPEAYNPQEEQMQLTMQDTFIKGSATGFVSVISHPDAVRYVQVWEKNSDGVITSKQVDLFAATGRDFSSEESRKLVRHLAIFHQESTKDEQKEEVQYAHFFVESGSVNEQSIRLIATALVMQNDHQSDAVVPRLSPVVSDTSHAMLQLGKFLHNEISEKLRLLKPEDKKKEKMKKLPAEPRHNEVPQSVLPETAETKTSFVREAMVEWYISQTIVRHVPDVPVAAQAALFWFAALEHRTGTAPPVDRTKKDERVAEKPRQETQYIPMLQRLRTAVVDGWRRIFPEKKKVSVAKLKVIPEKPALLVKIKDSVRVLVRTVRERFRRLMNAKQHAPVIKTESPFAEEVKKEEQDTVVREIRVALILWRVLSGEKSALGSMKQTVFKQKEAGRDSVQPDAPLWILLAIIRYLTLLRESGNVGQTNGKGTRPKRKKTGTVKFTFASW